MGVGVEVEAVPQGAMEKALEELGQEGMSGVAREELRAVYSAVADCCAAAPAFRP